MERTIITIEKSKLIVFLTEIETFLLANLPELCEECCASYEIQNLKHALGKTNLDFHIYIICMRKFVLHLRNCIRKRASLIGNPEAESIRIHVENWPEVKKTISHDTSTEELVSIASRLVDEAFSHLSEILLNMVGIEIDKTIKKSLLAHKKKRTSKK